MKRFIFLLVTAACCLLPSSDMRSCGPEYPEPAFVFVLHPDAPMARFAAGKLGVLRPTFARSYLAVVFRYAKGIGLDSAEQGNMLEFWSEGRSDGSNSMNDYRLWDSLSQALAPSVPSESGKDPASESEWWKRRDHYQYGLPQSSFRSAWMTLTKRIKTFGAHSPEVKFWLYAERFILKGIPDWERRIDSLVGAKSETISYDRAYLEACSAFYSGEGDYQQASLLFRKVSEDDHSPWRSASAYMIARCHIRQAYSKWVWQSSPVDTSELIAARVQLQSMIKDNRYVAMKADARALLDYVEGKLEPMAMLHKSAVALLRAHSGSTISQTMADYRLLLNHYIDIGEAQWELSQVRYDSLPAIHPNDEITDWIRTFQSTDETGKRHALDQLKKKEDLLWLSCVAPKLNSVDKQVPKLIETMLGVGDTSALYQHFRFHAIRLLIETGQYDRARTLLDRILSRDSLGIGARNQFLSLRMKVDGTLDDFLGDAPRQLVAYEYEFGSDDSQADEPIARQDSDRLANPFLSSSFDADATGVLNTQLPLRTLHEIAADLHLPKHLRARVALAAWTRAVLINDEQDALLLARDLDTLAPGLHPFVERYLNANRVGDRDFAAIDLFIRHPGVRPLVDTAVGRIWDDHDDYLDHWGDNWWRSLGRPNVEGEDRYDFLHEERLYVEPVQPTPFITPVMKQQAATELALLRRTATAPNYLIEHLLKFAATDPTDARIPEDLHLAIFGTRYGSADSATLGYSRRAWTLLHTRYKKSVWARRTPHYFSGN